MTRIFRSLMSVLILALILPAGVGCKSTAKAVSDSSFQKEVLDSKIPVLVDFWAVWCGPCRIMGPVIEELNGEYKGRMKVLKMDVDKNSEVPGRYSIQAIPTLLLFKEGKVARQFVGVIAKDDLKKQIADALERSAKPDQIVMANEENFDAVVLKSKIPVLVDFWAPWCGPCRVLAPMVEELSWEYEGRLKVAKLNIDENKTLARKYKIQYIPELVLFKGGKRVKEWTGVRPKADYVAGIEQIVPKNQAPSDQVPAGKPPKDP